MLSVLPPSTKMKAGLKSTVKDGLCGQVLNHTGSVPSTA